MTQVCCSLVFCILRRTFAYRLCTAKHLLSSVCRARMVVAHYLWVSPPAPLSSGGQLVLSSINTGRRIIPAEHEGSTASAPINEFAIVTNWMKDFFFFPQPLKAATRLAVMNLSLWALTNPGGRRLHLVPPAVLQVNRGKWQHCRTVACSLFNNLLPPLSGYCGPMCNPVHQVPMPVSGLLVGGGGIVFSH